MTLGILHLSDIHINGSHHPVLTRTPRIAAAAIGSGWRLDALFIVVSGDIAQGGKPTEYVEAERFFHELASAFRKSDPDLRLEFVFVPGNHDCNLSAPSDIRQTDIIEPKLPDIDLAGALAKVFLAVQDDYFEFSHRMEGEYYSAPVDRLCHRREFTVTERTISFTCFNTAWLTQNPERPARLFFPLPAFARLVSPSGADLSVAVFHHPVNWLMPSNAHDFKLSVESSSDILMSGHEHTGDTYSKEHAGEGIVHYKEAEALWDPDSRESAFSVLLVDLDERRYNVTTYRWKEGMYLPAQASKWETFHRNPARTERRIENNDLYLRHLEDLGSGFTHRHRLNKDIHLSDLFVYPDLRKRLLQAQTKGLIQGRIRSRSVIDYATDNKHLLIVGNDKSGKTALARTLYSDLRRKGFVPLLLQGTDLRPKQRDSIESVADAYCHQYSKASLECYKQLPPAEKVIIVDDLNKSKLRGPDFATALGHLERLAERVILLVGEFYRIEELAQQEDAGRPLIKYDQCDILPFCTSLLTQLIRRWVSLGSGVSEDPVDIDHKTKARERAISSLLGRKTLPPYPMFILALLQAYEAQENLNATNGSLGELWQFVITERLASFSGRATEVGTLKTYTARIAYFMFINEKRRLTKEDLGEIHREYFRQFELTLDPNRVLHGLLDAQILEESGGGWRFKYPAYYHFFVARYFMDNVNDRSEGRELASKLRDMADHLYYEVYANVVMFYLFLSVDVPLIEYIVKGAAKIYGQYEPCNLEDEVTFINRLYIDPAKPIALSVADMNRTREEVRDAIDEGDEVEERQDGPTADRDVAYNEDLAEIQKINIAFKTLQVLGQVLRSFPGVLKAEVKTGATRECYVLGLRVLSAVLKMAQTNLEELRKYYASLIKEHRKYLSESELAVATDEILIRVTGGCAYGVVKRISQAVGADELIETYKSVFSAEKHRLSVGIVDFTIKMEHT